MIDIDSLIHLAASSYRDVHIKKKFFSEFWRIKSYLGWTIKLLKMKISAPTHTAKGTIELLEISIVRFLEKDLWLSNSLDLNTLGYFFGANWSSQQLYNPQEYHEHAQDICLIREGRNPTSWVRVLALFRGWNLSWKWSYWIKFVFNKLIIFHSFFLLFY